MVEAMLFWLAREIVAVGLFLGALACIVVVLAISHAALTLRENWRRKR